MNKIRILVTTDNHLGYKEDDSILKMDSFENFQAALNIGVEKDCQLVLQIGDLFHIPEPSNKTIHHSIRILETTLGRAQIKGNSVDLYQLKDKNTIPLIMINGNHDWPNQLIQNQMEEDTSCLDLLEKFGVARYIGKEIDKGILEIEPFIIQQKEIIIGVYAISYQKDDKLNTLLTHNKIIFKQDFNLTHKVLMVHQNRPGLDNPFSSKDAFNFTLVQEQQFDLILWGHEHETFQEIQTYSKTNQRVYQPGSTIATSLHKTEQDPKRIGVLDFYQNGNISLNTFEIPNQRTMLIKELNFQDFCFVQQERIEQQIIDKIITAFDLEKYKDKKLPLVWVKISLEEEQLDKMTLELGLRPYVANPHNVFLMKKIKIQQKEQAFIEEMIRKEEIPEIDKNSIQQKEIEYLKGVDLKVFKFNNLIECLEKYIRVPNIRLLEKEINNFNPWIQEQSQLFKQNYYQEQEKLNEVLNQLKDPQSNLEEILKELKQDIDNRSNIEFQTTKSMNDIWSIIFQEQDQNQNQNETVQRQNINQDNNPLVQNQQQQQVIDDDLTEFIRENINLENNKKTQVMTKSIKKP